MTGFHCFTRLPLELRRHIWRLTVNSSHLEIHVRMKDDFEEIDDYEEREHKLWESGELQYGTKAWPALHSCHEARESLQEYFITPTSIDSTIPPWINWDSIRVVCKESDIFFLGETPWATRVVNLTPFQCTAESLRYQITFILPSITILTTDFGHLKDVIIIPEFQAWRDFDGPVYFDKDWFEVMESFHDAEAKFRVWIGGAALSQEHWLSSQTYTTAIYTSMGYWDSEDELPPTSFTPRGQVALLSPVFQDEYWSLKKVDRVARPLFRK